MSVFTDIRYTIKIISQGYTDIYEIRDWSKNPVCIAKCNFLDSKLWKKSYEIAGIASGYYSSFTKLGKSVMTTKIFFETPDGRKLLEISKEKTWSRKELRFEVKDASGLVLGSIMAKIRLNTGFNFILQDPSGNELAKTKSGFITTNLLVKDPTGKVLGKIHRGIIVKKSYDMLVDIFDKTFDPLYVMAIAVVMDIVY